MKALSHKLIGRLPASDSSTPSSQRHRLRIPKENVDPGGGGGAAPTEALSTFGSPSSGQPKPLSARNRTPLPPRHPTPSNPLKRKICLETVHENGAPSTMVLDSGVKVVVRMRPKNKELEEGEKIVQKVSQDSVSIAGHAFTFDSVADSEATQEYIFQLVGLPLVENCLAGFNSSIFAYGQTGSGKTYTMWGPPCSLAENSSVSQERGLTPRVFEQLFLRISEEQAKNSGKQLSYKCRCSFLEIYNEQITDLLDPNLKNLQLREDVKTGVYVDYLKEEYVCTMKDVTQLLIKGLANRRTGATSINAESSRSHCVFTCIVESRYQSTADGLSSLKTSRINLVDLAGSERQKLTGAGGERLKEAGNINRSLSQLGNLINILAEVSQSGKHRHIPYRDSKLTFLLQESLGGNAKLAMICAISPFDSCKSETFSTLRFAQRAKAIKNKAVVNETTENDVYVLREQIRQLKDELLRMKSNVGPTESNGNYSTGWSARRSLNLLRMSLSRPNALPLVKEDSDEEMEIDEEDVEKPGIHAAIMQSSFDEKSTNTSPENIKEKGYSSEQICPGGAELVHESEPLCSNRQTNEEYVKAEFHEEKMLRENGVETMAVDNDSGKQGVLEDTSCEEGEVLERYECEYQDFSACHSLVQRANLNNARSQASSAVPGGGLSLNVHSPELSISPRVECGSRKSLRTSLSVSASQKNFSSVKSNLGGLRLSFSESLNQDHMDSSPAQSDYASHAPTEHLEASLQLGLQIIDNHQRSSAFRRSSFRFSPRPADLNSFSPLRKVEVGVQTLFDDNSEIRKDLDAYICTCCKNKASSNEGKDISTTTDLQLVPVHDLQNIDHLKKQIPKAVEKVLAGAIRREMALEDYCNKQAAEITQLNRLIQQYKHERECYAIVQQTREDKIARLERVMDGVVSPEEYTNEEFISLAEEFKLLKENYENHPEVLRMKIELNRVQEELDGYKNFFNLGERDVLIEEVQDLKIQLQYYVNSLSSSARKLSPFLQLPCSAETISALGVVVSELPVESFNEKLEQERRHWTETESKWISLAEELRLELEASRSLSEKCKFEMELEKKCTEELKEALQTAIQGHARILEQYADLEEKHIGLLGRHRRITEGIADVKRACAKSRIRSAETMFIESLAAEISALKAEREKERRYWREEKKGLQVQLRDTAEAVQAAGELLVRLKEAEEAAAAAQKRALIAEQETEKAYQEIDNLKKNYDDRILLLNQFLAESRLPREALAHCHPNPDPTALTCTATEYDGAERVSLSDQRCREEFKVFREETDEEFSKGTQPYSWYSDYDRCNI